MGREAILSYLGADWTAVQQIIADALKTDISLLSRTNDGILSHGGKMLRPMVALLIARACGSNPVSSDGLLFAAAAELLHNATLLHDDVADKSDTRRGKPTVRSILGPDAAVLVGDFWLSRTVETVMKAERRDKVVHLFSNTMTGLAEGEMLQLQKAGSGDTSEEDYLRIIYCKTALLFEAACVSGAVSADAPDALVEAARKYSIALGTAFQIKDDILDYDGAAELGKPVGIDVREQKITLPLLEAMSGAREEKVIRRNMLHTDRCPWLCGKVRRFVHRRGGVQKAALKLDSYINQALEALEAFPPSPARDYLAEIARYNAFRTV